MIWQNGWAFAGLAALAIPILIHLLSRQNARVERFPTLRFLPVSQSAPVRRTRITDPLLLLVRVLILVAAVAALAQPLFPTADRTASAARRVIRAVVVDTSASTRRLATSVASVRDSARIVATALVADASASVVIETATPAAAIPGASSWLGTQNGRRELIIVSDFQADAIDSVDLRAIAAEIAIQLERIPVAGAIPASAVNSGTIALLTSPASRAGADAALRAASPRPLDTSAVAIAIVYPDAPERADLNRDSKPVTDAGLADALVRMRRDHLLSTAILTAEPRGAFTTDTRFTPVSRTDSASAPVYASQARVNGRETLVLFPSFDPPTLASAALISAAARAAAPEIPPAEADPTFVADADLERWERTVQSARILPSESNSDSDGRWLWLVALILLGVETLMRRRPGDAAVRKAANAR